MAGPFEKSLESHRHLLGDVDAQRVALDKSLALAGAMGTIRIAAGRAATRRLCGGALLIDLRRVGAQDRVRQTDGPRWPKWGHLMDVKLRSGLAEMRGWIVVVLLTLSPSG